MTTCERKSEPLSHPGETVSKKPSQYNGKWVSFPSLLHASMAGDDGRRACFACLHNGRHNRQFCDFQWTLVFTKIIFAQVKKVRSSRCTSCSWTMLWIWQECNYDLQNMSCSLIIKGGYFSVCVGCTFYVHLYTIIDILFQYEFNIFVMFFF